jgi:rhodanese-related sulfurtransferase
MPPGAPHSLPAITRDELLARLGDPALTVVDVLPRESYEAQHIRGAVSLPVAEIPARAGQVLPDRDRDVIVYCGGPT